jgi:hypothetical protein
MKVPNITAIATSQGFTWRCVSLMPVVLSGLHAGQKNGGEAGDCFAARYARLSIAIDFGNDYLLGQHPRQRSYGDRSSNGTEGPFPLPNGNVTFDGLVQRFHVTLPKDLRQLVTFEGGEQHQTNEVGLAVKSFEKLSGERFEVCLIVARKGVLLKRGKNSTGAVPVGLLLQQRGVKIVFGWKMPEEQSFVDSGFRRDLARFGPLETVSRENANSGRKQL